MLATYPDTPEVRRLAEEHGFEVGPLAIRDAHRRNRVELLLRRGMPGRPPRSGSALEAVRREGDPW